MIPLLDTVPPTFARTPHGPAELIGVSFSAEEIRSDRVVVAKVECTGIDPYEIECRTVSSGFVLDPLQPRTRQGDTVLIALRIHRCLGAFKRQCMVKFSAGSQQVRATIDVLG